MNTSYTILSSIIGASHAIIFQNTETKDKIFTEIIANYDVEDDRSQLPEVNSSFTPISTCMGGISPTNTQISNLATQYDISFTQLNLNDDSQTEQALNFKKTHHDCVSFQTFTFPSSSSDKIQPKTQIALHINLNTVTIHTIHIYPNEQAALVTKSLVELI